MWVSTPSPLAKTFVSIFTGEHSRWTGVDTCQTKSGGFLLVYVQERSALREKRGRKKEQAERGIEVSACFTNLSKQPHKAPAQPNPLLPTPPSQYRT